MLKYDIKENVELDDKSNRIFVNLILDDKEIYDILYNKNGGEKIDLMKRSIKIGIIALRNAAITVDTNYVQREVERLIGEIDQNVKNNLGKDGMSGELEKVFGKNGKLEYSLLELFKNHETVVKGILSEENINNPLYKIRRYIEENSARGDNRLYEMLDPGNDKSLMYRLKDDIFRKLYEVSKSNNLEMINKSICDIKDLNKNEIENVKNEIIRFKEDNNNKILEVKKSIYDEIGNVRNIATEINLGVAKLTKEIEVIDRNPEKGMRFEDILYRFLSVKALKYGDTVDLINISGGDRGGDYVINVKGSKDKIIIKAESTSKENVQTVDTIFKHLNKAMRERSSEYGIKVYENPLPEVIGPMLVGDKKIICSYLGDGFPLEIGYEILRAEILKKSLGLRNEIDFREVKYHIDNIIRLMENITNMTGNLTKMDNLCKNTKLHLDELRKNISNEIDQVNYLIVNEDIDGKEKIDKKENKILYGDGDGEDIRENIEADKDKEKEEYEGDKKIEKKSKAKKEKNTDKSLDQKRNKKGKKVLLDE